MFHQINELMVLGMHPAIQYPRRSQIRPLRPGQSHPILYGILVVAAGPDAPMSPVHCVAQLVLFEQDEGSSTRPGLKRRAFTGSRSLRFDPQLD